MIEASEIDKMSLPDRLRVMERLWDAVCREEGAVSSPDWHRQILTDRKARAESGEARFLTLAQLRKRLRGQE
jgi:putative addiction module component (TIGR02574 family)